MGHFGQDHTGKKIWITGVSPPPDPPPTKPEYPVLTEDKTLSDKIFGIGYPKTGSSSLVEALKILGYNALHAHSGPMWNRSLVNDLYGLKALSFDAYVNVFPKAFYLYDSTFPNSKFILTTRDPESWLSSLEPYNHHLNITIDDGDCTFLGLARYLEREDQNWPFALIEALESFGSIRTHKSFIYKLEQHTREVEYYFRDRPDDLLVVPVESPDKSDLLSNFLSKEWPSDRGYPHFNKAGWHHGD